MGCGKGGLQGSSAVFQLLFRAVDTLGKCVEAAAAGAEEPPDAALMAELERAAGADRRRPDRRQPQRRRPRSGPAASPMLLALDRSR